MIKYFLSASNNGLVDGLTHTTVFFDIRRETIIQERKKAQIRNLYNQLHVPHLTQDTIWERDKHTRKHHIQKSQEVIHSKQVNTRLQRTDYTV